MAKKCYVHYQDLHRSANDNEDTYVSESLDKFAKHVLTVRAGYVYSKEEALRETVENLVLAFGQLLDALVVGGALSPQAAAEVVDPYRHRSPTAALEDS